MTSTYTAGRISPFPTEDQRRFVNLGRRGCSASLGSTIQALQRPTIRAPRMNFTGPESAVCPWDISVRFSTRYTNDANSYVRRIEFNAEWSARAVLRHECYVASRVQCVQVQLGIDEVTSILFVKIVKPYIMINARGSSVCGCVWRTAKPSSRDYLSRDSFIIHYQPKHAFFMTVTQQW